MLASATEMALLFHPGVDPSRLYYGTDTRAQDILTGAALGILLFRRPAGVEPSGPGRALVDGGGGGAAVFVWEWTRINGSADLTYQGGFLLADLMVALVICGVTLAPAGLPARVLSLPPLTFIGRISYGLYLWHWPIFLVLDGARTGLEGYSLFALRFAVTLVIAVLSWYLVETPVRQMKFGGWRSWTWVPVGAVDRGGRPVGHHRRAARPPPTTCSATPKQPPEASRNAYLYDGFAEQAAKGSGAGGRRFALPHGGVLDVPVRRRSTGWWSGAVRSTAAGWPPHCPSTSTAR